MTGVSCKCEKLSVRDCTKFEESCCDDGVVGNSEGDAKTGDGEGAASLGCCDSKAVGSSSLAMA